MLLALAVLLLQPQVQPKPVIAINSSLGASAAVSSSAVSGGSNAAANAPAEPEAKSSSAAYSPVFPAATPAAPAEPTPAASPEPFPAEPIVLPVPDAASESSSLVLNATPVTAGQVHPFKSAVFSVIDPKFENARDQRMWLALSMTQHAAAGFDSWTTRREISSGQAQELNPLLKPFASNNSLYLVMQVTPVALDYLARRMMYSSHSWQRKIWWMPQVLGTASSFVAGAHNLGVRATPLQ